MNIRKRILILLSVAALTLVATPILADTDANTNSGSEFVNSDVNYLKEEAKNLKQTNLSNPNLIIGGIVQFLVGGSGAIALLVVVYGGFIWMTAAGNAEKIGQAQKMIMWALLGLVAMLTAYLFIRILLNFASTGNAVYTVPTETKK